MTEPRFILKDPNGSGSTLIYLIYRMGSERLKYSTRLTINPAHWNPATQRPIMTGITDRKILEHLKDVDYWLNRFSAHVVEIVRIKRFQKTAITTEILKTELDKEFRYVKETKPKISFLQYARDYIDSVKFAKDSDPPRPISPATIRKYNITYRHLENFTRIKRSGKLSFDEIGKPFYDDFIQYLQIDCNQANNTVGKNIAVVLMFARAAYQAGLIKNDAKFKGLKKFSEPVFNIYLTEEDLNTIYSHDFSKQPKLDRVRDYFIIGCRTALRFSDFTRINQKHILSKAAGEILHIITRKTNQEVFIPLHWQVKTILEKWEYRLPRRISVQKTNEYLKKIGEICQINEKVMKAKTKGGHKTENYYQKWELITTHTARRTGATLMYKGGVPVNSIMAITGHTTETEFLKYIKLTKQEHAEHMLKHPYFSSH